MENNSLTDIIKSRREAGEGVFSSLGGAAKERLKEKLDFKRILPQGGLLTALFPKLKAYKAQKAASPGDRVLKNIDTDFKLFAKNSEKLESIAINFLLMKREINKLARLEKVSPAIIADKSIRSVSISDTSSPAKMETEKESSMFLLIVAVAAVGAAMTLGYKKLEESFDLSISGSLKSLSNLGGDLYDKLKSSFETLDFKKLIFDNKDEIEKEVRDSFNRNKDSLLNKNFAKQIEDSLNIDVAAQEDADLGAAIKAKIEAENPMNYAQDGPATNTGPITPTRAPPTRRTGENIVSSSYGTRTNPVTGKSQMHGGIDIKGQTGDPIYSTGKGKAFIGKPNSGFGTWVIVDHGNGLQTYYGHMSDHLITNGQDVEAGTLIGRVGSTGISTGPHLHYQIMVNGQSVDPENNNPIQLKDYTFAKFGLLVIPEKPANQRSSVTPSSTSPTNVSSQQSSNSSLLDIIAAAESGYMGYDAANRGNAGDMPGGYPGLSKLTVNDVMRLQSEGKLFATGRYQIIPQTLAGLMAGYGNSGVKGSDLYDASTQDRLATALINERLKQGGGDLIKTQFALSQLFAAIANPYTGSSFYDKVGKNKASISSEKIQAALVDIGIGKNSNALVLLPLVPAAPTASAAPAPAASAAPAPAARADKTTPAGAKSASVDLLPFLLNRQYV
jgi:murein DD-endopeptidase MepM/ murein hydrolase activator NlpD